MKKHYRDENNCLNCGSDLQGKYCHVCGQENLQIKESFGHVMSHAISDYFHFDHQFFHTLKPLLFKPGYLTNEYMAGKRMQYLHPIKMYIFISLVYFLLLFSANKDELVKANGDNVRNKTELAEAVKKIKQNPDLSKAQKDIAMAEMNLFTVYKKQPDGTIDTVYNDVNGAFITSNADTSYQQYLNNQQKLPVAQRDGLIQRYFNKKLIAWNQKGGSNSRELIEESLKHNTPKLMFVLLPLFALMLKITFRKNNKYYVEHLIFTIHLHCFLFLFLSVVMIIKLLIPESWHSVNNYFNFFVFISIVYYLLKALKTVYQRSTARTISKMVGLAFAYTITFSISLLMLVVIAAIINL